MRTYAGGVPGEKGKAMAEPELIPLNEAARRLGVSKMTMARLVKEGRFTIYENPLDRRQKIVDAQEIAAAIKPRPLKPEAATSKKAARASQGATPTASDEGQSSRGGHHPSTDQNRKMPVWSKPGNPPAWRP